MRKENLMNKASLNDHPLVSSRHKKGFWCKRGKENVLAYKGSAKKIRFKGKENLQ